MERLFALLIFFCSMVYSSSIKPEIDTSYTPTPWDNLGSNMLWSVAGWPVILHGTGVGATYGIMESGWDAQVNRYAAKQDTLVNALLYGPGLLAGTIAPVAVPVGLYFFPKNKEWKATGAVSMQAVGIAFLYNNILKAATGRKPPDSEHPDLEKLSHEFQYGFLRGGVFFGWPSGHTMVNTAMAASIYSYHRNEDWALAGALAYSSYIGVSMTLGVNGHAHWMSDAVAGFLMGAGIGWTVGDSYYKARQKSQNKKVSASHLTFFPIAGEQMGLLALYTF
jgi:membrane-associated phospholipid phosphatase